MNIVNINATPIRFERAVTPWEGVLLGIVGRGMPPGSPNPDPISDQNFPLSTPVFRAGL